MNTTQTKLPKAIEEEQVNKLYKNWRFRYKEQSEFDYFVPIRIKSIIDREVNKALQTQSEEYRKRIEETKMKIVKPSGDKKLTQEDEIRNVLAEFVNGRINRVLNILKETK